MNNSTVTSEVCPDSTNPSIGIQESLEICVQSFCVFFGLPLHIYVIWLIVTRSGMILPSDFFLLNLSVCEILNSVNSLVTIMSFWFLFLMQLAQFISGLGITGRPLFQTLICVERYLAVVHPVTFLKYKPLRYRVICSAAVWIITLGSCVCCMFITNSKDFAAHSWFYSVQFFILICIQLFCCLAVLRVLKQSGPGERDKNQMKKRAFYLILVTTICTVIIHIPIIIIRLFFILSHQAVWLPSTICYVLAGFVQPALYLYSLDKSPCSCCSRKC